MSQLLFLYHFEFIPWVNPPRTKERFTEDLRAFIMSRDWDYGMSALGGMVATCGHIQGKAHPVTEDDREALARWAKAQRVQCIVRLGALEEDGEGTEFFRHVTEWVFPVDNLMGADSEKVAMKRESR